MNPVLDSDFPDPSVLHAPDGWFYAYATQGRIEDRMANIQVARSRDLVQWEHLGDALPEKPRWAAARQEFWAPHVVHDPAQGKYFLYYSAEPDETSGKCLAVAISDAPRGPFVDVGRPLLCGEGFEHIDPMAFDDPQTGKRLLYWGSGARPIKVQELAPDRQHFLPGSAPREILFPDARRPNGGLVEGAWMTFRNGTYYLFFSGDRCCTSDPNYAIMVARSNSALGPFERYGAEDGSGIILRENEQWRAPGHNSVVSDADGTDWIIYHAYPHDATQGPKKRRVMLLDRIQYVDGWPRIAGDRPSVTPQRTPALRDWR